MTKEEEILNINKQIEYLEEDRMAAIASGGRDMLRAYSDLDEIKELERTRYDLIHGTHTNELYHLNARLFTEERKLSRASTVNKKHYFIRIRAIQRQISELEELDKNIKLDEKELSLKK